MSLARGMLAFKSEGGGPSAERLAQVLGRGMDVLCPPEELADQSRVFERLKSSQHVAARRDSHHEEWPPHSRFHLAVGDPRGRGQRDQSEGGSGYADSARLQRGHCSQRARGVQWLRLPSAAPLDTAATKARAMCVDTQALERLETDLGQGGAEVLVSLIDGFLEEFPEAMSRLHAATAARHLGASGRGARAECYDRAAAAGPSLGSM